MRVARFAARRAVLVVFVFLALSPAAVLAFNPPNPSGPGNHFGEHLHNKHLLTSPAPTPGGGNNSGRGGVTNAFGVLNSGAQGLDLAALPAFRFQPSGLVFPALHAASKVGGDAWWVVVLLAAVLAANVVLAVLFVSRGGNYVFRRVLRPVVATG